MAQAVARDFGAEMNGAPIQEIGLKPSTSIPKPKVNFSDVFQKGDSEPEQPERLLMDTMAMRPRSMSHHTRSTEVPSRAWLKARAQFWRSLEKLGMVFHGWASPKAPKPSFIRKIATDTIPIELYFYLPPGYKQQKKNQPHNKFPVVVNFHGGGFTLGHATDDRYWAAVILKHTQAVFISSHAEDLHIDPSQVAISGFSAGGNLAFSVPFRLTYQYEKQPSSEHLPLAPPRKSQSNFPAGSESLALSKLTSSDREEQELGRLAPLPDTNNIPTITQTSPWSSTTDLDQTKTNTSTYTPQSSKTNLLNLPGPRSKLIRTITTASYRSRHDIRLDQNHASRSRSQSPDSAPRLRIVSVVAWYPLLDWTSSREEKKRQSRNPKKTLPRVFTDLFDFSYLPAPDSAGHHCSPYASPALAPDNMIIDGLPQRMQIWLCEWDMLLAEGELFRDRLKSLGKDVESETIEGVPHGWDKSPNPFRDQKSINLLYERAAGYLRHVFSEADRRATVGEGIGLGGLR
ncbi:hypothetical protein LTR05_002118 [Lithohypha guttulata]|uniref:Alpha/beta hydrolase fold-3 domain-containing protein n=1 Tax=Lithohypha guttulata TaxID=1690604 RepID=A0AAN7T3C9_9EURO|nr:hypothetical protein LTR05_002118 [Lithohypha guttulata]